MMSFKQTTFALAILASTLGTYLAFTPPNPHPAHTTTTQPSDRLNDLNLASRIAGLVIWSPSLALSSHTILLALFHPYHPRQLLRHGASNGLNPNLLTWSRETSVPLALNLLVGVPLRLASYATLGRDFTFALTQPEVLVTKGVYGYLQHPGYASICAVGVANVMLLYRADGVVSCWVPRRWYKGWVRRVVAGAGPVLLALLVLAVRTRVRDEEGLLRERFGEEWVEWSRRTKRFVPGLV